MEPVPGQFPRPPREVDVVVTMMSGEQIAEWRVEADCELVSKTKQLLEKQFGYPEGAQKLLLEGAVAEDARSVDQWPPRLDFTMVVLPFNTSMALQTALVSGRVTAVRTLVSKAGADSQMLGTALQNAAQHGHGAVVSLLLDAAPNTEFCGKMLLAKNRLEKTALHLAAECDRAEICRVLLLAAPTTEVRSAMLRSSDLIGEAAHERAAADKGHKAVCRVFLDEAVVEEDRNQILETALQAAARGGHETLVRFLLDAAPSTEVCGKMLLAKKHQKMTALHLAAGCNGAEICRMLLLAAPTTEVRSAMLRSTDLFGEAAHERAAANRGHKAVCRVFLEEAVVEEDRNQILETALQAAARAGHETLVRFLLDAAPSTEVCGKMLLAKNHLEKTALHLAAGCNRAEICRMLLLAAPTTEVRSAMLHSRAAAASGHKAVCDVFLEEALVAEERS